MANAFEIREHMEVIGSDGQHVGTVDQVEGDRLKLTRSDSYAGGVHHFLDLSMVEGIDDGRVLLTCTSAEARSQWHS